MMRNQYCFNGKKMFFFLSFFVVIQNMQIIFFSSSIGQEHRPIEALLSACALGILHNDIELSELVLKELKEYERNDLWCHHIAFLMSELYLKKVKLTKTIHIYHIWDNTK